MKVEAIKAHRYAGKIRVVGDQYEAANKSDLRLIKALGWVKDAEESKAISMPAVSTFYQTAAVEDLGEYSGYSTRVMTAEEKPKRTYTRRKKVDE